MRDVATLQPMTMGEVLDRSFQVLRRHLGTLYVTAALGIAPMLLVYLVTAAPYGGTVGEVAMAGVGGLLVLLFLVMMVTMVVTWGALTREVGQAVTGGPVSFVDGVGTGFRAFFRMVGLGIVLWLVSAGAMLLSFLPAALVAFGAAAVVGDGPLGTTLMAVAFAAAFVGAAILVAPLAFMSLPALIQERVGPVAALRRANHLGKGARVRVLLTAMVAYLVMLLPTFGLPFLFGMGAALWSPAAAGTVSTTQYFLYQASAFLVGALTTPFMVAAMVLTYYDRRVRREGYDVELASESFAGLA